MFYLGDRVVYPMYGAGVIKEIEKKEIDGVEGVYYVISMPIGNLKITVSANKAEQLGLRKIVDSSQVYEALHNSLIASNQENNNWNQRYKENLEKIKTGKIEKLAEVIKNLWSREKEKGLSSAEKKMFTNAKQILISEVILSEEIGKDEAELKLLNALN